MNLAPCASAHLIVGVHASWAVFLLASKLAGRPLFIPAGCSVPPLPSPPPNPSVLPSRSISSPTMDEALLTRGAVATIAAKMWKFLLWTCRGWPSRRSGSMGCLSRPSTETHRMVLSDGVLCFCFAEDLA